MPQRIEQSALFLDVKAEAHSFSVRKIGQDLPDERFTAAEVVQILRGATRQERQAAQGLLQRSKVAIPRHLIRRRRGRSEMPGFERLH